MSCVSEAPATPSVSEDNFSCPPAPRKPQLRHPRPIRNPLVVRCLLNDFNRVQADAKSPHN